MNGSQKAQNLKTGDSLDFDREEARSRYNKLIDQAPDMHKLATQVMVGSTSFEQDLTEKLTTMKYGDLGISDEVVNQLDPTDDGQISSSDASVIVDGIMQDENMLRGYLTDYFTIYEEREFKANIPTELKDQANEDEFA